MDNFLKSILDKIAKPRDPEGWDKRMSREELNEFLKFGGTERDINTVDLSPDGYYKYQTTQKLS